MEEVESLLLVQEKETNARVNAIKKIPIKPPCINNNKTYEPTSPVPPVKKIILQKYIYGIKRLIYYFIYILIFEKKY